MVHWHRKWCMKNGRIIWCMKWTKSDKSCIKLHQMVLWHKKWCTIKSARTLRPTPLNWNLENVIDLYTMVHQMMHQMMHSMHQMLHQCTINGAPFISSKMFIIFMHHNTMVHHLWCIDAPFDASFFIWCTIFCTIVHKMVHEINTNILLRREEVRLG